MDLQHIIDIIFGTVLAALIGFGKWIVTQMTNRPTKEEVRQLINDRQEVQLVQVQDIKEDIQRLEKKIDKLIDKSS
jgi:type VI protein secretion system component VasK